MNEYTPKQQFFLQRTVNAIIAYVSQKVGYPEGTHLDLDCAVHSSTTAGGQLNIKFLEVKSFILRGTDKVHTFPSKWSVPVALTEKIHRLA
jgi:hypothetical protein